MKMETWHAQINQSILGPVVPQVRRQGRARIPVAEAPEHVRQYLNLPENRHARPVLGGLSYVQARELQVDAEATEGGTGIVRVTRRMYHVLITFRVKNPTWQPPRPKLTVKEHGPLIRHFRGLLDYFGAEAPRNLNRRIYKDTECGASISVYLKDGTALHNGDPRWDTLTGTERLQGFTIQTIVEGSDATVDSDVFRLPCTQAEVKVWIADMEAQATELGEEANG